MNIVIGNDIYISKHHRRGLSRFCVRSVNIYIYIYTFWRIEVCFDRRWIGEGIQAVGSGRGATLMYGWQRPRRSGRVAMGLVPGELKIRDANRWSFAARTQRGRVGNFVVTCGGGRSDYGALSDSHVGDHTSLGGFFWREDGASDAAFEMGGKIPLLVILDVLKRLLSYICEERQFN